jgi:hypothetical protein
MFLLNAFSVSMVPEGAVVKFTPLDMDQARSWARDGTSAVGHVDTARLFAGLLGRDVPVNRASVTLTTGSVALVGQYSGPRLPEGATALPEGATISWFLATVSALDRAETSDIPVVVAEAERASIEKALAKTLGVERPLSEGSEGNSPFSPQTVVYGPRGMVRGTRVTVTLVARSHDGTGQYKGRGRWRTVVLLTPSTEGARASCDPSDRGAGQIGGSDVWTRPWETHEAETRTGGLGLHGAAALRAALAKARILE